MKCFRFLLIFILSVSLISGCGFENNDVSDADILTASFDAIEMISAVQINELLQDRKAIIFNDISSEEAEAAAEKLGIEFISNTKYDNQISLGFYIEKGTNGSLIMTEVIAEVADRVIGDKIIETSAEDAAKTLEWIRANEEIHIGNTQEVSSEVGSEEMPFAETVLHLVLYAPLTESDSGGHEKDTGKLADIKLQLCGNELGTEGNDTYDEFICNFIVNPVSDVSVETYHIAMGITPLSQYEIYDQAYFENQMTDPQTVINNTGGRYVCSWEVTPNSKMNGEARTLTPYISVKSADGVNCSGTASAEITYIRLDKSGFGDYVSNTVKSALISYKNHKEL